MSQHPHRLDDYELFYMEIPSDQQELEDIEIIDVSQDDTQASGLSEDQVSYFPQDMASTSAPEKPAEITQPQSRQRQLFDN